MQSDVEQTQDNAARADSLRLELDRCQRELSQHRQRLRLMESVFVHAEESIIVAELDGKIVDANPSASILLGYTKPELLRLWLFDVFATRSREEVAGKLASVPPGQTVASEYIFQCKDGEEKTVRHWLCRCAAAERDLIIVSSRDITQTRREDVFSAGEKRLLEMVAQGETLSSILSALCSLFEEIYDGSVTSVLLADPRAKRLRHGAGPTLSSSYIEAIKNGVPIGPAEGSCGTAASRGEPVFVSDVAVDPLWQNYRQAALACGLRACWSMPIFSSQRQVLGTFATYFREPSSPTPQQHDIIRQLAHLASIAIERTQVREDLERSEAYLAEAQKLSLTGSFGWNVSTGELFWSNETFRILGYAPANRPSIELVLSRTHPEDVSLVNQILSQATREGTDLDFEHRLLMPDGTIKNIHVVAHALTEQPGGKEFFGAVMDVTAHRRAAGELEKALSEIKRSEHSLSLILEGIPGLVHTMTAAGKPEFVNQQILRFFGKTFEELDDWTPLIHPDDRQRVITEWTHAVTSGEPYDAEHRVRRADGVYRWFQSRGKPVKNEDGQVIRWYNLLVDIDDRKKAEEALDRSRTELAHVTRMTALGELAASIAHEINQPLAAIVTNGNACLRWLDRATPNLKEAREAVQRVVRDGNRGSEVIGRIRTLLKKEPISKIPLSVNQVVQEILTLTQGELRGITLETKLADELPNVIADRVRLQQVLLNLIMNAIDAMKTVSDRPCVLRIETKRCEGDVLIEVQDTGVGIPPDCMERLFETFYTTKPQGLGMGLSISRSIVEEHGGQLWAESNQGSGAIFRFTLPATKGDLV